MLGAFELQTGEQVLLKAGHVVLWDEVGLVADSSLRLRQEGPFHDNQNYYYQHPLLFFDSIIVASVGY